MDKQTSWDPDRYAKNARFVSDFGEPLIALLHPKPGELILDLGCGDGDLTEKIASTGCHVIAVDASFEQIKAARLRGLTAAVMDGHKLSFRKPFDAIFTNAALHWMKDPENVVRGVWTSLKMGGRFTGEFGGKGNVETIRTALHAGLRKMGINPGSVDPWYFPSPQKYSELLKSAGFSVETIQLIPRPTLLPGDILGWLEVFAQPFTKALAEADRKGYLEEIRGIVSETLRRSDGTWVADYVRLRFLARKEA